MAYDYIIVGGGSAGSVLANRLSARSANKVLLCEAGQDTPHGEVPPEILDSYSGTAYFDPRFHWTELKVHTEVVSHNNPHDEPAAPAQVRAGARAGRRLVDQRPDGQSRRADRLRRMGGARRRRAGSWDDVLPYFKKVERDLDFDGPWHGKEGRIPVRRILARALDRPRQGGGRGLQGGRLRSSCPTRTASSSTATFPITISNAEERRVSAAIGYLDAETRQRENLTISTETQVTSLLFEGTRCVGVKALVDGQETEFRGREVILSSGAIHSPAHLLRAGIGPVGHLRDIGHRGACRAGRASGSG